MKELLRFVREFFRTEHKAGYYVTLALFLAAAIAINYAFSFETKMRQATWGSPFAMACYVLFYGVPLTYAIVTYAFWYNRWDLLRSRPLWIAALASLFILSFNGGFTYHVAPIRAALPPQLQYFALRCSNNVMSAFIYGLLIGVYWWVVDRKRMPLYGLRSETFTPHPFFLLLLVVAPLILWASFQPDFLAKYPRYTSTEVAQYYGISNALPTGLFELCYGLDFVSTEFFFRGFMVLALAGVMGRGAVFPMVAVYCFLHFEKPLAEAISSIPGGIFLGIVSYNTRSIYGGIILHLGVAWMMEIAAFLQLAR